MPNTKITSLHSPHVERVKALLGSRGKKIRREEKLFIADGLQSVREAITSNFEGAPVIEKLYLNDSGQERLFMALVEEGNQNRLQNVEIFAVSDEVMNAMAETETPQGILALCSYSPWTLYKLSQRKVKKVAYFWEIQDPGNAGTVIRNADACGFDAIIFSAKSVDVYSPKTVRSTVGSIWHIPIVEDVALEDFTTFVESEDLPVYALSGDGENSILDIGSPESLALIFGNEARGLPPLPENIQKVHIPIRGKAESFNVASAAAIAMFQFGASTPTS